MPESRRTEWSSQLPSAHCISIGAQELLIDREGLRAHALLAEIRAHMVFRSVSQYEALLGRERQRFGYRFRQRVWIAMRHEPSGVFAHHLLIGPSSACGDNRAPHRLRLGYMDEGSGIS